jgi:TatD DNase family protein
MLIETDSPYLSPEPLRGKRNDSRNVKYIAKKIAEVKQIPLEEVAKVTYENAKRIFDIKNGG